MDSQNTQPDTSEQRLNALLRILGKTTQGAFYALALGTVAIFAGSLLPQEFAFLSQGFIVNAINSILDQVIRGKDERFAAEEIQNLIIKSEIADVLRASKDIQGSLGRLYRQTDILNRVEQDNRAILIEILKQSTQYLNFMSEVSDGLNQKVREILIPVIRHQEELLSGQHEISTVLKNILHILGTQKHDSLHTEEHHSINILINDCATVHAPEPFVAHRYQFVGSRLIGREAEMELLADWVGNSAPAVHQVSIFNIVGVPGIGKSMLAWTWFNNYASKVMQPLAGMLWWNFDQEKDFGKFVSCALAYMTGRPEEVKATPLREREARLLRMLDSRPFLVVFDEFEKLLNAYTSESISQTLNQVDGSHIPESRYTFDVHVGLFLKRLATCKASKVLICTRDYPADLENEAAQPVPGSFKFFLPGLDGNDAIAMCHEFGVYGSEERLLSLIRTFGGVPIIIRLFARRIAAYHRAPGDFDNWQKNNPNFSPFGLSLELARLYVSGRTLQDLDESQLAVLRTIAAFHKPPMHDALTDLLIGDQQLFASIDTLDRTLAWLVDQGWLGWEKRPASRYSLQPYVRGVVLYEAGDDQRRSVYERIEVHLRNMPIPDIDKVKRVEELFPVIERYNALVNLGHYDNAGELYRNYLEYAFRRFNAMRQQVEVLEMLLDAEQNPRLSLLEAQVGVLDNLGHAYYLMGQPQRSIPLYRKAVDLIGQQGFSENYLRTNPSLLPHLAAAYRHMGQLFEAERAERQALILGRDSGDRKQEALGLRYWAITLMLRGMTDASEKVLHRSRQIFIEMDDVQLAGFLDGHLAELALFQGAFSLAAQLAKRAWKLAQIKHHERDLIRVARIQGMAALGQGTNLKSAGRLLYHALLRARDEDFVEEEIRALLGLAELRRQQADPAEARKLLDDVWELVERGSYRVLHADALNILAQIERDAGNNNEATKTAEQAYRRSWCDGRSDNISYVYYWGLETARMHLRALDILTEPYMPSFDETKLLSLPEVAIDPSDNP